MLSRLDEITLIARCVATDDRRAFGKLVEAYQDDVRRFLLNMCGDPVLTADLAQETFLKAYLSIRSFKGLSKFRTWLFSIACNQYFSHKRSQRQYASFDVTMPPPPELTDNQVESTDTRLTVEECLRTLSDAERSVVLLFYMHDYPIKKIVEITGMPEGTVKSHLLRAKRRMAETLRQDNPL